MIKQKNCCERNRRKRKSNFGNQATNLLNEQRKVLILVIPFAGDRIIKNDFVLEVLGDTITFFSPTKM